MNQDKKESRRQNAGISRREFARRAALASAIVSVGPAAALSAERDAFEAAIATSPRATGLALSGQGTGTKLSPESHAEVEARIQAIFSQYGSRFSDEQKTDIRRLCELAQPPLDRLRAYARETGDSPALYLKPLVEREKNPLENTRVGKTPSAGKP